MAPVLRHYNIYVTSIEPGPVQTSFIPNINKNNQGSSLDSEGVVVDAGVDEVAGALRKKFFANYVPSMIKHMQTGHDVAQVIKKCIYSEKPPVR
ncbi:hypothetical protein, partial [Salmonella sp. s54395]|uniref:hypothetical protein n=1 Tax=Salmonella sp. s54395 TaxID=3159664 RepID=UPI003980619B